MKRVAFIGLGNMGLPMAVNLLKNGFDVRGFDKGATAASAALAAGVAMERSAIAAVTDADVVVTMLPNGAILRQVYGEIVPAAKAGALVIDCSTVDVESARAAHDMARNAGLKSVDAPVSGGVGGAAAGTLTFMSGADVEAFEAARPILSAMGKNLVHCGEAGAGQAAKICNNMVLGISMIAVCEAFALADKLGLSRQAMFDVVSTSSGQCWSINTYCPAPGVGPKSPADNEYKPGFAAPLMLKDLGLSQQAAASVGVETPLGQHAAEIYARFVAQGGTDKDFSGILPWLAARANEA
ncbi:3-hydroxyisobutyrate dehydrogenase [Rhodomicrobium vannielii ATCC 17100]|uniref:3-hydroxyisobutyrate dehydrogenase n=1 Tax=Rhodomicrobium vannielii (strain ATCC 17100 / DSM 162 / LMG 4299 / NCIMB 10020 / ATH 3.1.1) TaxID=648757 RepID=E3I3E8_RHOVT|nr:3-hydroxyisobutyrate dehydrogenase [Rhodomicrobium vannielii]ADP72596.1 3-hydroxyisobutyrate dehydrogenase [Rhodomicrobium vannielii ATCC 17100]